MIEQDKYIVWLVDGDIKYRYLKVGGLDDHFKTKEEAEQSAAEWKAKGYTDVIIERGVD